MIEWNDSTTALNDMLRSELVTSWINDATQQLTEHRARAAKFAANGNHPAALREITQVNECKRRIAYWREALEVEARS